MANQRDEWRSVPGWEETYEVTRTGQVRSLSRVDDVGRLRKGRILVPISIRGYLYVNLSLHGVVTHKPVHELVLLAFVGPKPRWARHTRHLDGNSTNNSVRNLAWGTAQDNADDRRRYGSFLYGESNPKAKITQNQAEQIHDLLEEGRSRTEIAVLFKVSTTLIGRVARGESWPRRLRVG